MDRRLYRVEPGHYSFGDIHVRQAPTERVRDRGPWVITRESKNRRAVLAEVHTIAAARQWLADNLERS